MNIQEKLALINSVFGNDKTDDKTRLTNASVNIAVALAAIHTNDGKVDTISLNALKLIEGQLACIGAILEMPEISP